MVRADSTGSTERRTMSPTRVALTAMAAMAVAAAGCGSETQDQESAATTTVGTATAVTTKLDGLYGAELDHRTLRNGLAPLDPPLRLPGGWWTLRIDGKTQRLVISHPATGDFTERITAVEDSEIRLAPSVECEQRGPGRTQPARLAWFRSGAYLRFQAIDVPCLTTNVLLTNTLWLKG
jgi:hypothetical protein